MQCWPLCSCLTDVYVCTWIPFPAPVSAWQERGPEYSQPDMVMTAAPFRSYMTLLVQALLLKLVRITLPYLGNPHPKSSSSREGSRAGRCHLTRPMESVFHTTALCPFSLFGFVLWVWYQSGWPIGNVQTSFLITSQPLPFILWERQGALQDGWPGDMEVERCPQWAWEVRCWSGLPGLLAGTHPGTPREFLAACAKLSRPLQRLLVGFLPPPLWVTRRPRRRKEGGGLSDGSSANGRRLDLPSPIQLLYFEFHQQKNCGNLFSLMPT